MVPNLSRKIFAILALSALSIFSFFTYRMKLGLDLQGGARVVYSLDFEEAAASGQISGAEIDSEAERYELQVQTAEIFQRRLDVLGTQEINIYPQGENQVAVEMPGGLAGRVEEVKSTLENQGSLQFRIVAGLQDDLNLSTEADKFRAWRLANPGVKAEQFNRIEESQGGPRQGLLWYDIAEKVRREEAAAGRPQVARLPGYEDLEAIPVRDEDELRNIPPGSPDSWDFTGADLSYVGPGQDQYGYPAVSFSLVEHRKVAFADFTEEFTNRPMAIVLNGEVHSAPNIEGRLAGGGIITGGTDGFSVEEQRELITVLRTGSLRIRPRLESESFVGPSLGQDSIRVGIWSSLAGGALVFVFMIGYYWLNGVVACLSLVFNGFLLLGALSFTQATLTLPGIAGLVLTIGMAVDANILIFERVREERRKGREVPQAYRNGFERAFITIIDSNLTTLITGLILYKVGTGPVRGFAVTLSLGILTTLFSVLVFSKVLLHFLVFRKNPAIREVRMASFLARETRFDFLKHRRLAMGASALLIAAGLLVFGMNFRSLLGIDFVGGASARLRLAQPTAIEEVRALLPDYQVTTSAGEAGTMAPGASDSFLVKKKLDPATEARLASEPGLQLSDLFEQDLRERLGDRLHAQDPFPEINTVGARVSGDIQRKAVQALILSLIAIVIYVNFRFKEWRYGLAGVAALFHDVLFSLGAVSVYSVLRFGQAEINLETIAAFLTIIGYSINDTIVIFDRIRENLPRRKIAFADLINESVNQTLSRTILTALTVFLTVLVLFAANRSQHNALEGFALAMLVGTVAGTYSTVYIASPMLLILERWTRRARAAVPAEAAASR